MSINCQDNIGKQSHRIFWPTVSSGITDYTCFTDKLCLNFPLSASNPCIKQYKIQLKSKQC